MHLYFKKKAAGFHVTARTAIRWVAYVVAFTIELWWILEAEATLPAPAYVLCAGYFFVFILSALLLHGLTVKRTLYLLGWLFMVGMFTFPEALLVLFMTFHFWQVKSLYGLTEITCWVCRLVCNIAGMVCVQSLYSTWKEEKVVLRRLQALNMASILTEGNGNNSTITVNSHPKAGMFPPAGYTNAGFMNSTSNLSTISAPISLHKPSRISPVVQRSWSNASQFSGNPYQFRLGMVSEFNAATFNGMLAAGLLSEVQPPSMQFRRSQSVGDLRDSTLVRMSSYSTQPASVLNYVPVNTTQSLDRRVLRYNTRMRHARSMDELNNLRYCHNGRGNLFCESRVYNVLRSQDYFLYNRPKFVNKSRTSLTESDDLHKIRDVAL